MVGLLQHLSLSPQPCVHLEMRICPFTPYILRSDELPQISSTLTFTDAIEAFATLVSQSTSPRVRLIYSVPRAAISSPADLARHMRDYLALRATHPALWAGFDVVGADTAGNGWTLEEYVRDVERREPGLVDSVEKFFWHAGQELVGRGTPAGCRNLRAALEGVEVEDSGVPGHDPTRGKRIARAQRIGHGCLSCVAIGYRGEKLPHLKSEDEALVASLAPYFHTAASSNGVQTPWTDCDAGTTATNVHSSAHQQKLPPTCIEAQPVSNHLGLGIVDWRTEWTHLPTILSLAAAATAESTHVIPTSPSSTARFESPLASAVRTDAPRSHHLLSIVIGPDDPACWGLGGGSVDEGQDGAGTNLTGYDLLYTALAFTYAAPRSVSVDGSVDSQQEFEQDRPDVPVTLLKALEMLGRWSVEWAELSTSDGDKEIKERKMLLDMWEEKWDEWVAGVAGSDGV
ncbi:hypothetical protein HDU93_003529 [Gonapodya sp. JEL0774]|nr:hypothetical protein HDU93_003529 [Gonapodya sp. JEL0774]